MDRFRAITAFVRIVESGSLAAAARRMDVSVSALSRLLAELESHLGARLIHRTTRRLALTETGRAFYERAVQLTADLAEAEEAVSSAAVAPRGTLRLTSSAAFGTGYLASAIADFRLQHRELRFEVELSERAVDLVDEALDLAIRIGPIGSQALIGRRIADAHIVCCASPAYLERHPAPTTPADLAAHECLIYEYAAGGAQWSFVDPAGATQTVRVAGSARANNGAMLAALAISGAGIAYEPDFIVAPAVRAGRLVPLLRGYAPPSIGIHAMYPSRRHLSAKVRTFVDFLVARFEGTPPWKLP
ncbi:MAG TPA: LysR family transcriptional regulator [Casimicrobiaceae bacterium]